MKNLQTIFAFLYARHSFKFNRAFKVAIILLTLLSSQLQTAFAQSVVKGKVTDAKGGVLPGVSVKLQGSTTGTTTNNDGEFSLNAPLDGILEFTYIGYVKITLPIGGKSVVTAILSENNQNLNEVVVVGYGTTKKVDVTGSISSIKGADLQNLPVASVTQALDGRAAGALILYVTMARQVLHQVSESVVLEL